MPKETVVRPKVPAEPLRRVNAEGHPNQVPSIGDHIETSLGLSVGWNPIGWVQIMMEPHDAESTGDWHIVDLDRKQINSLIRTLRKARDRAYEADA